MCLKSHLLLDVIAELLSSGVEYSAFHFGRLDNMPTYSQKFADHGIKLVI